MKIKLFTGGILESNGYVLYQKGGRLCYIIDPGHSSKKFIKFVEEQNLHVEAILLTHPHPDHVAAVKKIRDRFDCPVGLHQLDMDLYKGEVDLPLEGGMIFDLEGEKIRVEHTPGHTAGGVCFVSDKSKAAFTGDTIFADDLGRTDLEGGSEADLLATCVQIIDKWSNEMFIYPGHGPSVNMKKVRSINAEFIDRVGV